ncbi:MAG TPA: thioredoxin family protein [Gammaproteobacteria bacterium]|nr:thioredoxin family protein [Gammaproteobacteria bacterium]
MLLDTPICDFGWKAPEFALPDLAGNTVSMSEQLGNNGLLIAFICNHCPYVKAIAERLTEDAKLLQSEGINVVAIMSNDYHAYPADSPVNMRKFAEQYNFSFPYLVDETQQVGRQYGAICTPDFFGFNKTGELQYRGRLDDAKMTDASSRQPELVEAMRLIAKTDHGPQNQVPSMGCSIKWR